MVDFDNFYNEIKAYVQTLENSYLTKHLKDPGATPSDYDLDVKSYCILCHAAFEEFAETLAAGVMTATIDNFIMHHKISESLVSLMHFKSSGDNYLSKSEDDDKIEVINSFDYIKDRLLEIKDKFSKEIFNNHGVALKYMKQLLMPVAIDIPKDPTLQNSLKQLAKERGAYAHRLLEKGTIKKSINPEDAKTIVNDCLKLCYDLKEKGKARLAN